MQKLWKFIEVKLKFFSFIAGHVEHQYRTMMLFIYKDVHKIVSGLLRLFVEAEVLSLKELRNYKRKLFLCPSQK